MRRRIETIFRQPVFLPAGFDDRRSRNAAIADPVPGLPGGQFHGGGAGGQC